MQIAAVLGRRLSNTQALNLRASPGATVQITVLIPTLNEAKAIGCTLERLQQLEPPVRWTE